MRIERRAGGWRVYLDPVAGRVDARTIEEVCQAVRHYYAAHNRNARRCPVCRRIEQERKRA